MILSFKHDPNHSDRFLRSVLKIWNVNTRRQECDRAGMSAAVENSDYNVHKQAERLLSDDTSLQFKPRHDGGKARQGEARRCRWDRAALLSCPCSPRPAGSHQGPIMTRLGRWRRLQAP